MKIATTSICKNEIKFIDEWYNALKDEVDYIVILDTGSTDGTYEKLLEMSSSDNRIVLSQKVFNPWRFDSARNVALSMVPSDADIFISIDLDERFEHGFGKFIKDNWRDDTLQMTYRYTWSHNDDGTPAHEFTYSKICFNDGNWIWKYPVHESLNRIETSDNNRNKVIDAFNYVHLHHYQDKSIDRKNYLSLLEERVKESTTDMDYMYLAREYVFNKMYDNALTWFNKIVDKKTSTLKTYEIAYVRYMIGMCYYLTDNTEKAIKYFNDSILTDPKYRDPYIDLAKLYISKELYAQAKWVLQRCFKETERRFIWTEVNDVWGYVPYDLLSVASFNSDDKILAISSCSMAIKMNCGNNLNLNNNFTKILNNCKDIDFGL